MNEDTDNPAPSPVVAMDDHEREHYKRMIALYKSAAISGILAALAFATITIGAIAYMVTR